MSKRSNIWIIAMACIVLSVLVASVYAEDAAPQAPPQGAGPGDMSGLLKNLTEKGFDVTEIQAAEEKGDKDSAKALLDKFFEAHPEAKPQMPPMDADRMKKIVSDLASKGSDVSAIQTALDGGDSTTAQKLLDDFFKEHPDARPTPPADGQKPPAQ
ncbi:MAG: hypothetical protein LUQ50_15070 [Methanospirillum sp.]|uniref:hypothetical protein n=1 Tax=Methanospirillum sp. TaxID=45200 RepID=UPI0023721987|nr:hypothetical protein [Methanospirillum sp.]MDD1730374.1 hypothetical protein [Methanospirillum sp.]